MPESAPESAPDTAFSTKAIKSSLLLSPLYVTMVLSGLTNLKLGKPLTCTASLLSASRHDLECLQAAERLRHCFDANSLHQQSTGRASKALSTSLAVASNFAMVTDLFLLNALPTSS